MSISREARNRGNSSANIFFGGNLEKIIDNSKGAVKVVSEEEGDMVSMVALDNLDGLLFKGSSTAMFPFLFIYNKLQNNPCQFDCALSPYRQRRREDVLYLFRLSPGTKTKNGCNTIKIHQKWNTKICATVKDKKSIKNLVVKTKIWRGREILSKGVWGLINTCCTNVSNKIHLPLSNYMVVWLSEEHDNIFFVHTSENL